MTAAAIRTSANYSRGKLSLQGHRRPHHRNLQSSTWSIVQFKADVWTTFFKLHDCDLREARRRYRCLFVLLSSPLLHSFTENSWKSTRFS
jgi:hypothetical protein